MKLDFTFISQPVLSEDRNTVTGKIGDQDVTVSRRMKDFAVELVITVDGVLVHMDTPNEQEKDQFRALYERALTDKSNAIDARRTAATQSNAFKKIFRGGK